MRNGRGLKRNVVLKTRDSFRELDSTLRDKLTIYFVVLPFFKDNFYITEHLMYLE